jgi:hypothetical protein
MTDIEMRARDGFPYIEAARSKLGLDSRNDGDSWRDITIDLADNLADTVTTLKRHCESVKELSDLCEHAGISKADIQMAIRY